MTILRNDKAKILRAYFEKSISKDQMVTVLNDGTIMPPIPWIFESEEAQQKDSDKRELLSGVLGITFQKIKWI